MFNESTVEIDAPIEKVFDVANNRIVDWSLVVVEDEILEETEDGVGTTFRVVTAERGKRMEFAGKVLKYDPPFANSVEMIGQHFDIFVESTFEDLGGRTRMTQVSNVQGKGIVRLMFTLFGWMMRKSSCEAQNKELESLKALAEKA